MPSAAADLTAATGVGATVPQGAGSASAKSADEQARKRRQVARRKEDAALVEAALRGEEHAFQSIVERYQRQVYWIAYDVLLDREEARDVAQETFIRVHAALDRFDLKRDFLNWIYRIARNLAIDALRRRRRRAMPAEDLTHVPLPDADDRPDLDLESRVARVLGELPVEYRLALTMREFHGMTPREIAAATDCSYPTARWRLHRARNLFRKAWETRYGVAPAGEDFA
jgi:RNA polymerase sigma-70 factor (ECF subfamily)